MGVSNKNGTPKSSILIRISIINHPFWGSPIFGNIHIATLRENPAKSYCKLLVGYMRHCERSHCGQP